MQKENFDAEKEDQKNLQKFVLESFIIMLDYVATLTKPLGNQNRAHSRHSDLKKTRDRLSHASALLTKPPSKNSKNFEN